MHKCPGLFGGIGLIAWHLRANIAVLSQSTRPNFQRAYGRRREALMPPAARLD